MALFPCDADGQRYPGRQCAAYVRVGNGNDFQRWKLRLCPAHVAAAQDDLAQFKVDTDNLAAGWSGPSIQCVSCLQPVDQGGRSLYVTIYPANNEREDYYGILHEDHDPPSTLNTPIWPMPGFPPVAPPQNVSIRQGKRRTA